MKETLSTLRNNVRLTIKDVAKALNVSERAVYNYEKGVRQINIKQVLLLAELYQESEKDIILAQINSSVRPIK